MMKNQFLILLFLGGMFFSLNAQTKLISHKSHSGNKATFNKALNNELFDINSSNFGGKPMEFKTLAKLDTLIHLSDTSAIMITSKVCSTKDSRRSNVSTSVWQAGRDTLEYHPLFIKKHSLDSIKDILDEQYKFDNPADSVVFLGYDNIKPGLIPATPELTKKDKREERKMKRKIKREKKKLEKAKKKGEPIVFKEYKNENQEEVLIENTNHWNLFGLMTISSFLFSFVWIKLR